MLQNTPYVDISYKWAGGGLISTAHDLTKFGNALLTCYQFHAPNSTATQCGHNNDFILTKKGQLHQMTQSTDVPNLNCILDPDTISMMWTPVVFPYKTKADTGYGMGWVVRNGSARMVGGRGRPFYAAHSGGAIGASSILVIMPADTPSPNDDNSITKTRTRHDVEFDCEGRCKCVSSSKMVPKGVVVAVLFNLQEVSNITSLGVQIAEEFLQIQSHPQNVIRFCRNNY
ncbi:MAG: hypothetical protein MJE68_00955 [Proteobacteria bacterium]|nr:hypothetical protein [Pseudomonadota bacterium]